MEKYIGFKMVEAEPITMGELANLQKRPIDAESCDKEGYRVIYPDGYESWSPKEVFEKAYMEVGSNNSITQQNVDDFIKETHISTIGEKTTLVRVVLVNGFEIIETSSCVDKANYDEKMGAEICLGKIKDKIWFLLGFLLQTAMNGIK